MSKGHAPKQLAKFLAYVLGRRPDEFGLVPDDHGFCRIKDLLKAVCEEDGWRYVRRSHLNEILLVVPDPPVTIEGPLIRAVGRNRLPVQEPSENLPKLLYTCVRRRAYPHILRKGMLSSAGNRITLSASRDTAKRIGRRSDGDPVLLTVQVRMCGENGVVFYTAGETLFTAEFLPLGCFTGPPLPREEPEAPKQTLPPAEKKPGTFTLKPVPEKGKLTKSRHKQRKNEIAWKKGRRRMKKQFDNPDLS